LYAARSRMAPLIFSRVWLSNVLISCFSRPCCSILGSSSSWLRPVTDQEHSECPKSAQRKLRSARSSRSPATPLRLGLSRLDCTLPLDSCPRLGWFDSLLDLG